MEARGELASEGLTLSWQFKAKYAHVVLPTPHARNYVHSTCYTLPSQPIDHPCQYQFLQEIKSSLPIQIYFTKSRTEWELKHIKIEHCINTVVDLRGAQGTRTPTSGPKFLHFHAVFRKK